VSWGGAFSFPPPLLLFLSSSSTSTSSSQESPLRALCRHDTLLGLVPYLALHMGQAVGFLPGELTVLCWPHRAGGWRRDEAGGGR
jgi:hypothetical protein